MRDVEATLSGLDSQDVVGRIWARDHTVGRPGPDGVAARLGWLDLPRVLRGEVFMGKVIQASVGRNPARQSTIQSGIPVSVPATTINMVCGSGLKTVILATQAIKAGDAQYVIAQNSPDDLYNPDLWSKYNWTVDAEGIIYYCQITFGEATEDDALAVADADAGDLAAGCSGFGWSALTTL